MSGPQDDATEAPAESVKRQQGTLPGKTNKNPREEHCNEIELRCEEAEGGEI